VQRAVLLGDGLDEDGAPPRHYAVIPALERLQESSDSLSTRNRLARYISPALCLSCNGARLRPEALAVRVGGRNIHEVARLSVSESMEFFGSLAFTGARAKIAAPVLKEIRSRLGFLAEVGLHYVTLDRLTGTLSTGESQRTRLATQIGSGLTGVCYILDEPSIGLHPRDHDKLLDALERLREAGNTVIVVEHDEATIRRADWVLDLGPGGGLGGGHVVFNGARDELLACSDSLTAEYLSGRRSIPVPERRRKRKKSRVLAIREAREHNLKGMDVSFPLGLFICVTGVSGSGKSSLVNDILLRALRRKVYGSPEKPGRHRAVEGIRLVDKVLEIDQTPIGKTPRSTPATYVKVFDEIRRIFAGMKQAQVRGYDEGRFSFNSAGGRCEVCGGMGQKTIEMNFLPDMQVQCEACHGQRYNEETLQVTLRGRHIADVLAMTVEEALEFFRNYPEIERRLRTMRDVGIGYLTLGQSSKTLSGGEAQRIKLARELGKVPTGNTLYCLDEPTTGLHFDDIQKLLRTLHSLVDVGNTVIVIEHNLEVIKNADYVIDLGPDGGEAGGSVVAVGTPEEIAACESSHTGLALRKVLSVP
jgi:excinuclease ABC subunit A